MVAEGRGPLLHARVGMLRAMIHGMSGFSPIGKSALGKAEAEEGRMKETANCGAALPVSNVMTRRYFAVRAKPVCLVAGAKRRHNRGCRKHHDCGEDNRTGD